MILQVQATYLQLLILLMFLSFYSGYMSPEYALYGQFSEKSDVFSFGVLLLEIVSGKRNTVFYRTGLSLTLLGWVSMLVFSVSF